MLLLCGCKPTPQPSLSSKIYDSPVIKAGKVGEKQILSSTSKGFNISVSWNNYDAFVDPGNALTGLEGSTNNRDWYELGLWPYQPNVTIVLTNRPSTNEFYRAFNRLKL